LLKVALKHQKCNQIWQYIRWTVLTSTFKI
jgi:hypothetical protein